MRRLLVLCLLGLLMGVGLVTLIEQDPGYVFLSLGSVTIETSFWFALLLWLFLWLLLFLALRLVRQLWSTRRSLSSWFGSRKHRNAAALTNRGLISFIEGNWARARKQLLRAGRYSEAPLVNHLMAARASFRLGDTEDVRRQLGAAEAVESDASIAVELTQADMQLSAGRYEQALATLVRARGNASKHPYVLELLARAHWRLGDWDSLRALLPELRKHNLLETAGFECLEDVLWQELLAAAAADGDTDKLDRIWRDMPSTQRDLPARRVQYVACLISLSDFAKADRLLVEMLDKSWDPSLVALIGTFPPGNTKKLLKTVGRWLESHGGEPVLLHAAGRVALFAESWEQARTWLQEAHNIEPTAAICLELARLREAMGDKNAANVLVRQAAELAVGEVPTLPLPSSGGSGNA